MVVKISVCSPHMNLPGVDSYDKFVNNPLSMPLAPVPTTTDQNRQTMRSMHRNMVLLSVMTCDKFPDSRAMIGVLADVSYEVKVVVDVLSKVLCIDSTPAQLTGVVIAPLGRGIIILDAMLITELCMALVVVVVAFITFKYVLPLLHPTDVQFGTTIVTLLVAWINFATGIGVDVSSGVDANIWAATIIPSESVLMLVFSLKGEISSFGCDASSCWPTTV